MIGKAIKAVRGAAQKAKGAGPAKAESGARGILGMLKGKPADKGAAGAQPRPMPPRPAGGKGMPPRPMPPRPTAGLGAAAGRAAPSTMGGGGGRGVPPMKKGGKVAKKGKK